MSALPQLPPHKLFESPNSRAIEVGNWVITARTNPISNAGECDALQAVLRGMPLPEMTFGNNTLELEHKPTGWKYQFGTEDALKGVKNGELVEGDGGVKVGYADAWLKSRCVLLHVRTCYFMLINAVQASRRSFPCLKPLRQNLTTGRIQRLTPDVTLSSRQNLYRGIVQTTPILSILYRWQS